MTPGEFMLWVLAVVVAVAGVVVIVSLIQQVAISAKKHAVESAKLTLEQEKTEQRRAFLRDPDGMMGNLGGDK